MDKEFFEKLLNRQVTVEYKSGRRISFTVGEVIKVTPTFVVIANEDSMVSVLYESIVNARTLTEIEINRPKINHDRERREQ